MEQSYVISVSLCTGCYRHIQISSRAKLRLLHKTILSAFSFSDDHAHAFFMDNHLWSHQNAFFSMELGHEERLTSQYTLKGLNLRKGDKFKYLFDFGDEWVFQCKVLQILEEPVDFPQILRSVGPSPAQYPDFDNFAEDSEEDEENSDDFEDFASVPLPEIYPEEKLRSLYSQLPLSEKEIHHLHDYFDAAANLYGILPLEILLKIYNEQNPPISEDLFIQVSEILRHEPNGFSILGAEHFYFDAPVATPLEREIIALPILMIDPEKYYELFDAGEDKPYVVLPKAAFLQYVTPGFLHCTPHTDNMLRFLKRHKKHLSVAPEELLRTISLMIWMDEPLQVIVDASEEMGITFKSKAEIEEFVQIYQGMNNNTRKISNHGQTPLELAEQAQKDLEKRHAARFALRNPDQMSLFEKE